MKKEYDHVLFDWDGCLYDSLPLWHRVLIQELALIQVFVEESVIARHIMPNIPKAKDYGVTNIDAFLFAVISRIQVEVVSVDFNAGALALIEHLAEKNVSHAVVTSSDRQTIDLILNHHKKTEIFPHIVTRNDVSKTKPHPEPLFKAIGLLQKRGSSLMVGDNFADILAGQAANIDTALYYPSSHEKYYNYEALKELNPTYVVREFSELQDLLS